MAETELKVPPPDFLPQIGRNITVEKPTIAAVNGVAYAGGFLLAQCCDLCIAADSARFAISEVKVGRGAPWAAPLPWLIPPRVAMEMLLTGEPVGAERAMRVGLVNQVVPLKELHAAAQNLGESIAANAPLSVAAAKKTVGLIAQYPLSDALTQAEQIWKPVYESEDAQEGPVGLQYRADCQVERSLTVHRLQSLLDDLRDETKAVESILIGIRTADWSLATPAHGWSIGDQVTHLAYFDEAATLAAVDEDGFRVHAGLLESHGPDFAAWVADENRSIDPGDQYEWFRQARDRLIRAFEPLDAKARVPWVRTLNERDQLHQCPNHGDLGARPGHS